MSEQLVKLERTADGIAIITLARAASRNALTLDMARQLRAVLAEAESDPACRVVVLHGEGKAFCAGLDLKQVILGADAPKGATENMALQELFAGLMLQINKLRQPVISAVQGAVAGAGFGITLASDIRIASPSAMFLIGAVKIGLSAGECGISYHLPRLIGAGRAFEIMLTGRPVLAEEAERIGLVTRIADEASLLDEAVALARTIAENSPYAVKHTKQVMWANLAAPSVDSAIELENHVQTLALLTEDFGEACQAFIEKRKPVFQGR